VDEAGVVHVSAALVSAGSSSLMLNWYALVVNDSKQLTRKNETGCTEKEGRI